MSRETLHDVRHSTPHLLNPQQLKIYPNLLRAVVDGLYETFEGRYADRVVADLLKRDQRWGSRDRAFIAESVYEIVRWRRLLGHIAGRPEPEFLLAAYWWRRHGEALDVAGLPVLYAPDLERGAASAKTQRAIRESIPDWLDLLGAEELGGGWPATLSALNQPAEVYLRTNTLKTTREALISALHGEGIEAVVDDRSPEALRITKRRNLWGTKSFRKGQYEVQDIGSQRIAHALDVAPGMTIVDACAGAGGKTLHLAALMQNRGRLIALDTDDRKLQELKRRAKRAGLQNVEARHVTSSKVVKRLTAQADRVLLDVPCSGLGVLRRNPDAKWKLQPGFLAEVKTWQADILTRYSRMLRPDGKLVYATCSILPSESEAQVEAFATAGGGWAEEASERLSPVDGYDGFYFARLARA